MLSGDPTQHEADQMAAMMYRDGIKLIYCYVDRVSFGCFDARFGSPETLKHYFQKAVNSGLLQCSPSGVIPDLILLVQGFFKTTL